MLELKASRFYQSALQSGLIDEAGLAACYDLIPVEKRSPDAIDRRLARQAISTGKLTLWQAQQILGGRSSGFKIDKYLLLDLLGRGGMGRVYLARDVRLNRLVALKILSLERMNNPRAIARFQREAKVGAQLQHENLVRVYDEGESGGIRYLVMEYIEGKNVGQIIGELGSIPWPTAARLGRQIALGLEHARLKELIHRDVNPCNILVTQDGTAKLTDLGLAIDLNDQDNVTRDGATVGTFDYVSPEQARHSRSVDTRADIYSLGCTIYHMIAGRVPFPVTSLPEKLYAHQLHDPDPLTELAPGMPEGLAEVVRKMMRKQVDERYQTPLEVAQALEPFAIESGWTTTPGAVSAPSSVPVPAAVSTSARAVAGHRTAEAKALPIDAGQRTQTATGSTPGPVIQGTSTWSPGPSHEVGPELPSPASGNLISGSIGSATNSPGSGSGSGTMIAVGDSFFPLDLGPGEPLSLGLKLGSKSKPKAPPKPKPEPEVQTSSPVSPPKPDKLKIKLPKLGKPSPRIVMIAAVAAGVIVVAAAIVTLANLDVSGPKPNGKDRLKIGDGSGPKTKVELARGSIVVLYRDGKSEAAANLPKALEMASTRGSAEVILAGGTTVRVENAKTIRVPEGDVTIRAADGARPVLDVVVKGSQPMFLINANLHLLGLTVVAHYETPADAPIFQVERELTMERCTFRAIGPAESSRLAVAEGRKASISGCLFEGFDTALEIQASPGMAVTLKNSIFLAAKPGDEAIGRVARVHSLFGQGAGSRLLIEGCSGRSGTVLDVGNFSETTPLEVEVNGSAFLVKTLLTIDGGSKAPIGPTSIVRWKGKDNSYSVTGPGWASFEGAPTGLDAWSKLAVESGSKVQPLKLAKEPPDPTTLKDCALLNEEGKPVGADPSKVGPR